MIELNDDNCCTCCSSPYDVRSDDMKQRCACCHGKVDHDVALDDFTKGLETSWQALGCSPEWLAANGSNHLWCPACEMRVICKSCLPTALELYLEKAIEANKQHRLGLQHVNHVATTTKVWRTA